jgi:hypothetical protein
MKKLLVMLLLLYPISAVAVTYEWTDDRGTVNFTEDLGKVPKKYRKRAKVTGGDDTGAPQVTESAEPAKAKPKADEPDKAKKLYGGKEENVWRKDFLNLRLDLQHAESEASELRGRLSDTSKMSRSEYLALQNTLKHAENRVQQLQKKQDLLRESADRLGVPAEFRQ